MSSDLPSRLLVIVSVLAVVVGCQRRVGVVDTGGGDAAEDGTDTSFGDVQDTYRLEDGEIPEGLSLNAWKKFKAMSPRGGIEPPTDVTNKYSDDPAAAKLGQFLFFEKDLSPNNDVSCASCHDPDAGFTKSTPVATQGAGGNESPTPRHTPTLLNVAYNTWYFWDGRRDSLWSQAIVPFENPIEMGGNRLQLAHYVADTPKVKRAYEQVFGALPDLEDTERFPETGRPVPSNPDSGQHQRWMGMSDEDQKKVNQILVNVMKAIAAYEMKLVSLNAPFDRYIDQLRRYPDRPEKRDAEGFSAAAKRGAKKFVSSPECVACHRGPMLMDGKFHTLGLPQRKWLPDKDLGRSKAVEPLKKTKFNAAGPYSDAPPNSRARKRIEQLSTSPQEKAAFRTPTLRNLPKTGPYMHGGHFETLQEVLEFYNDPPENPGQGTRPPEIKNLGLKKEDISDLKAFLKSLEGEPVPSELKRQPDTPLYNP